MYVLDQLYLNDISMKWGVYQGSVLSTMLSRVCGVISVLAAAPMGCGFKPGRGDKFLMAIKPRSMPSFGWEVKLEAHVVRFYGM
jgi:hypothetical protein